MIKKTSVVLTTTNTKQEAESLTKGLLDLKLAACVQIEEINSYYVYDGKFCSELEYRLVIKAATKNYPDIESWIKKHHTYQLPQIIRLDISDGLEEYIKWVHYE